MFSNGCALRTHWIVSDNLLSLHHKQKLRQTRTIEEKKTSLHSLHTLYRGGQSLFLQETLATYKLLDDVFACTSFDLFMGGIFYPWMTPHPAPFVSESAEWLRWCCKKTKKVVQSYPKLRYLFWLHLTLDGLFHIGNLWRSLFNGSAEVQKWRHRSVTWHDPEVIRVSKSAY